MADDKGTGPGNDGRPRPKGGATGGERASDLARRALAKNRADSWDTYRPKPKVEPYASRSGSTSVERARQSFNPAWLLVPAAGLLLGGLGIANINENADLEAPAVNAPMQAAPVTQTAAAAALTSAKAMAGCKISFSKTTIEKPVGRLGNLEPAAGMQFVVVNTTARNTGAVPCLATGADQRGYTGPTTYTTGDVTAGSQLDRGRRITRSIGVDKAVEGAYVFQIPTGRTISSVKLRSHGSETWTTVKAG